MKRIFLLAGWCTVALVCGFQSGVSAQEQRKIVLNEQQFKESLLEKVTVSGGIRAGFMYKSPMDHIDVRKLYLYLQRPVENADAMLCVNMISRDGRYAASWNYALGQQPAGAIGVTLPSKYQEQISHYPVEALVVLAAVMKQDCSSPEAKYIPASWGEVNDAEVVLYVNSGNTDTVIGIPGQAERIPCTRITAENTVAYDTRCVVSREMLAEPKSLYLLRTNFGNKLPNVEFPVR